jgi:hypothetical protein
MGLRSLIGGFLVRFLWIFLFGVLLGGFLDLGVGFELWSVYF